MEKYVNVRCEEMFKALGQQTMICDGESLKSDPYKRRFERGPVTSGWTEAESVEISDWIGNASKAAYPPEKEVEQIQEMAALGLVSPEWTEAEMSRLSERARKLGGETSQSTASAASSISFMAQAGVRHGEKI